MCAGVGVLNIEVSHAAAGLVPVYRCHRVPVPRHRTEARAVVVVEKQTCIDEVAVAGVRETCRRIRAACLPGVIKPDCGKCDAREAQKGKKE